jgi:hypothetical protein
LPRSPTGSREPVLEQPHDNLEPPVPSLEATALVGAILGIGKADEIVRLIESSSSDVVDEACSLITPEKFFNSRSSRGGFIDETVLSSLPGRFIIDVLRYLAEEARVRRPFTLERLTREAQFEVLNTLTTDEIHSYRGIS